MANEVTEEEYCDLQMEQWSKFYSGVVQYQEVWCSKWSKISLCAVQVQELTTMKFYNVVFHHITCTCIAWNIGIVHADSLRGFVDLWFIPNNFHEKLLCFLIFIPKINEFNTYIKV